MLLICIQEYHPASPTEFHSFVDHLKYVPCPCTMGFASNHTEHEKDSSSIYDAASCGARRRIDASIVRTLRESAVRICGNRTMRYGIKVHRKNADVDISDVNHSEIYVSTAIGDTTSQVRAWVTR
jgi:hypothetical protein